VRHNLTTFLLVRHGVFETAGERLAGRAPGIALSADGRSQVRRLATRLHSTAIAGVYTSPVQRAVETATLLASALRVPLQTDPALEEVDFGEWTGATFHALGDVPLWQQFNRFRTTTPIPAGESLLDVQTRVIGWMTGLASTHPGTILLAVTHAEVIRSAVATYAGISLDLALRLEIAPSSITELRLGAGAPVIVRVNDTAHLEAPLP
jgi:broad specificity phosphatase PhoE